MKIPLHTDEIYSKMSRLINVWGKSAERKKLCKILIKFWHIIFSNENQAILQLFFYIRYRSDERPFQQLLPFTAHR